MNIEGLVTSFRKAMDMAKTNGKFNRDTVFREFPTGCCGDTCYLLAEYLLEHGIKTCYVCGNVYFEEGFQSHAWLILYDDFVASKLMQYRRDEKDRASFFRNENEVFNDYTSLILKIENNLSTIPSYQEPNYNADSECHTVIDITGDQFRYEDYFMFYNRSVYVGEMDDFHRLFEIVDIHECNGLRGVGNINHYRMNVVYQAIKECMIDV